MSTVCQGISSNFLATAHTIKNLGEGSFGKVDLLRDRTGQTLAVKYQNTEESAVNVGVTSSYLFEVDSLTRLKNVPGIIQAQGFCLGDKTSIIALEPMDMNVRSYISIIIPEYRATIASKFLFQTVHALAFLELLNISHLDLKPENILVRNVNDPEFKLTDFGLAKPVIPGHADLNPLFTIWYRPPEFLAHRDRKTFSFFAGDIWSLGLTALEMLVGKPVIYLFEELQNLERIRTLALSPYSTDQFVQYNRTGQISGSINVREYLRTRLLPNIYASIPSDLINLIAEMLTLNPDVRPSPIKILAKYYHIFIGTDVINQFIPPVYDRRVNEVGIRRMITSGRFLKLNNIVVIMGIEMYTRFLAVASDRDFNNLFFADVSLNLAAKFFNLSYSSNSFVTKEEWNPIMMRMVEQKILLKLNFRIYNISLTDLLRQIGDKPGFRLDLVSPSKFGLPLEYWFD